MSSVKPQDASAIEKQRARKLRKRETDRLAQQEHRKRQRTHIEELKTEIEMLRAANDSSQVCILLKEIERLRNDLDSMKSLFSNMKSLLDNHKLGTEGGKSPSKNFLLSANPNTPPPDIIFQHGGVSPTVKDSVLASLDNEVVSEADEGVGTRVYLCLNDLEAAGDIVDTEKSSGGWGQDHNQAIILDQQLDIDDPTACASPILPQNISESLDDTQAQLLSSLPQSSYNFTNLMYEGLNVADTETPFWTTLPPKRKHCPGDADPVTLCNPMWPAMSAPQWLTDFATPTSSGKAVTVYEGLLNHPVQIPRSCLLTKPPSTDLYLQMLLERAKLWFTENEGATANNEPEDSLLLHSPGTKNLANFLQPHLEFMLASIRKFQQPTTLSVMAWVIYRVLQSQVEQSASSLEILPSWLKPTELQTRIPHHISIDFIVWPAIRDELIIFSQSKPALLFETIMAIGLSAVFHDKTPIMSTTLDHKSYSDARYDLKKWSLQRSFFNRYPQFEEAYWKSLLST